VTRSKRLNPIADLARMDEQQAAQSLTAANQELETAEAKLAELENCRAEYAAKFEGNPGLSISAASLREYRVFIQQLDNAIAMLKQQVAQKSQRQEQQRGTWLQQRHRAKALGDLVTRYRNDERRGEQRRSENEIDEFSQRTLSSDD
jgi:flagellar FliJ protein